MDKDIIYRQAAIDEIRKCRFVVDAIEKIRGLPSAEKPFKLPEIYVADGYDTVASEDGNVGFGVYVPDENQIYVAGDVEDEIRVKALLHEICHWVQAMCGRPFDEDEANEFSDIVYDALPSVPPKTVCVAKVVLSDEQMQEVVENAKNEILQVMSSSEPESEERPLTEDDYAYCAECDHVEMCRWYPMYGCEFKSRPSAEPEIVRCKDCWHNLDCDIQYHAQAGEEFYCGAAERRTDENTDIP